MGAALTLPFLEAMLPTLRAAVKTDQSIPDLYTPNGMAMEYWTPKGVGSDFELSPILEPLAPFRNQMLVLRESNRVGIIFTPAHRDRS
jgi:hypothetical protein